MLETSWNPVESWDTNPISSHINWWLLSSTSALTQTFSPATEDWWFGLLVSGVLQTFGTEKHWLVSGNPQFWKHRIFLWWFFPQLQHRKSNSTNHPQGSEWTFKKQTTWLKTPPIKDNDSRLIPFESMSMWQQTKNVWRSPRPFVYPKSQEAWNLEFLSFAPHKMSSDVGSITIILPGVKERFQL